MSDRTTAPGRVDASGAYIPVVPGAGAPVAASTAVAAQPTTLGTAAPVTAHVIPATHTAPNASYSAAAPVATSTTFVPAPASYAAVSTVSTSTTTAPAGTTGAVVAAKEIAAGRMPPNAAIQDVLSTARQTIEQEKVANPTIGQGQAADKLSNVIAATQSHLAEKNADEKYQRFVATTAATASAGTEVGTQALGAASGAAPQQMPPIGQLVRSLATSSEFRATLMSMWSWIQHVFAGTVAAPSGVSKTAVLSGALQGNAPTETAAQQQEELWNNFVQFMRVLANHPEYQGAVEGLFVFVDQMGDQVPNAVSGTPSADAAKAQARQMWMDARAIIEELAGGYNLQPLEDQVRTIRSTVRADNRLQMVMTDARAYFEMMLRQPNMLENPAEVARGRSLLQQCVSLAREYKDSIFVQQVFKNVTGLLQAMRNDPSNRRLAQAFKEFGTSIVSTNPETGAIQVNTQSLSELRQLLVPLVMEQLRSVPVSTIEGSTDSYDFKLEGIVLAANDIAPNRIRVKYDNDLEFDFRSLTLADMRRSDLTIYLDGMRTRLDNVHFWYRRKSFPKISDEGLANISLEGDGLDLRFRVAVRSAMPFFHVTKVDCDIDKMKIRILEAKHAALDKIVTSVFSGAIRKRVEKAVEERSAVTLQRVEELMNRLAQQAGQAVRSTAKAAPAVVQKVADTVATAANTTSTPVGGYATQPTGSSS